MCLPACPNLDVPENLRSNPTALLIDFQPPVHVHLFLLVLRIVLRIDDPQGTLVGDVIRTNYFSSKIL